MPDKIACPQCKGKGWYDALISQHDDDKTETVKCAKCDGKGYQNVMTDDEERDYHADYW